jgi:tellurite methyltransferase
MQPQKIPKHKNLFLLYLYAKTASMSGHINSINETIGATDIYLVDQIMKNRYKADDTILDAGCGTGRNLHWFLRNDIMIYGVDQDGGAINNLRSRYPSLAAERFRQLSVEKLPFENNYFSHIISSAVLHFASDTMQFHRMVAEMVRVLQPNGSLFIRMTSDIGIEEKVNLLGDGVYNIPDGSTRFLLTRALLADIMQANKLSFLEPLKTVNVNDVRCMSTLVVAKSN